MELPVTQYTRSGDVTIAYQRWGSGAPIVWVPGFISHVELNWEAPFFSHALKRGGEYAEMVSFDKRGTGLSDHAVEFGSFEERVDDIRAVMDAVGFERASVGGMSEGGPLAILFAAMYPERVDKLFLYGTFARFSRAPDYPIGSEPVDLTSAIEASWGTGGILKTFAQHAPDPATEDRLMARFERYTATPQQAAHILRQVNDIDVRAALPLVQAPTLVMHCAGDPIVPVALGRYIAEHVPHLERYVEFEGDYHASWLPETTDEFVDATEQFITGTITSSRASSERVLATVLFTDIVDSTARAGRRRSWMEDPPRSTRQRVHRRGGLSSRPGGEVDRRRRARHLRRAGPSRAVRAADHRAGPGSRAVAARGDPRRRVRAAR